jgi:hypothetical protein
VGCVKQSDSGIYLVQLGCSPPLSAVVFGLSQQERKSVCGMRLLSSKEEALASLGELLHSYAELQMQYSSSIHMPDYRAFSNAWETSLYAPIRKDIGAILRTRPFSDHHSLLYCAPGPHAPLLQEGLAGSLAIPLAKSQCSILMLQRSAPQNRRSA